MNCACGRDERDLRRDREIGHGIEHDARIGADFHLAGLVGRKIDVHVNIFDVEHGEDLAARGQHLADVGDPVLDAAVSRGDERVVGDVDLVEFDIVRGGVERPRGFADTVIRHGERGIRATERLPALVEQFVGGEAARDQRVGAVELLLREGDLGRLLHDIGARLIKALLRLLDLSLGLLERGREVARVHAGEDLLRL